MKIKIKLFLILFLGIIFVNSDIQAQKKADFDSRNWILSDKAKITEFAGRKVLTGSAYLKDVKFLNGTIEVDIYSTGERNFSGFMFRVQSFEEYEWCWLRMHKTNGLVQDAIQYAPVFNGIACWQLNGGTGGISAVNIPVNEWVHMKLQVQNEMAKLYVIDMDNPVMVMDNLQLGLKKGSVGLKTFRNGSVYFSNFSYKVDNSKKDIADEKVISSDILTNWQLSPQYTIKDFTETDTYPELKIAEIANWKIPVVERTGLVNITKHYGHKSGNTPSCAILRTYIDSDKEKLVKMNFGYSDAVTIFLNREPLFSGNSAYRSRNKAYGGWISYEDAIYLKLKKGKNELLVVIAEVFGGWGFQAKIKKSDNM